MEMSWVAYRQTRNSVAHNSHCLYYREIISLKARAYCRPINSELGNAIESEEVGLYLSS